MKKQTLIIATTTIAFPFLFSSCEVEKTQDMEMPDVEVDAESGELPDVDIQVTGETKLPKVDVDVEKGQLPKFDVDAPEVDVSVDKKIVEVPVPDVDVDVTLPKGTDQTKNQ